MNEPPDVPRNPFSAGHAASIKHRMYAFAIKNPKEAKAIRKYLHKANHLIKRFISLEGRKHSLLDVKMLYLKIVQIFDEINKLCKKTAKIERQTVLEQHLEAANKIRETGKEKIITHLANPSFAIASTIASMARTAMTSANEEVFKEQAANTVDKNEKLSLSEEIAQVAAENPKNAEAIKDHLRNANRLITQFIALGEGNHELQDIQIIYLKTMRIFDEILKLFSQKTH